MYQHGYGYDSNIIYLLLSDFAPGPIKLHYKIVQYAPSPHTLFP